MPTPKPFLPHGGSYKNILVYQNQSAFTMSHSILLINILKKVTGQSTKWYKHHVQGNRT